MDFGTFKLTSGMRTCQPDQQALIEAILEDDPTDAPGFGSGSDGIARLKKPSPGVTGLYPLYLTPQSLAKIPGEAATRWPAFFGSSNALFRSSSPKLFPGPAATFRLLATCLKPGIYEDSLDRLGPVLELILTRMRQNRYSSDQIESALRAGLLARLVLLWSRQARQPLRDLVAPRSSVVEFLWNEDDLSLFEFQATDQGRVNRAAIPWAGLRQRVMCHLAKVASGLQRPAG